MNLLQALRARPKAAEERLSLDEFALMLQQFPFGGQGIQQTLVGGDEATEQAGQSFVGLVQSAYGSNGVVFACMLARQLAFSTIRFQWQQMLDGRPSRLFGTQALQVLEQPWPGGTTQDLLTRVINDADLAGTSYTVLDTPLSRLGGDGGQELVRLRPDWVEVALVPRMVRGAQLGWRKVGYLYHEGGKGQSEPVPFLPNEVAQFTPVIDPLATWRGMSWLTPVVREIFADQMMTRHKAKFFENGATPNMVVKYPVEAQPDKIKALAKMLAAEHVGLDNAYRPIHIGGGADVTVVGADLQQTTFKEVQGTGETRIAAAARVHPVIVGLSEGLAGSSLNAGNYAAARRQFADGTMHPMWQNVAGSFAQLLGAAPSRSGTSVRLWYDTRDVPLLREDEKDLAGIQLTRAQTLNSWITAGYTPDSAKAALLADDEGLLVHSGLYSVQLQSPGAQTPPAGQTPAPQGGQQS